MEYINRTAGAGCFVEIRKRLIQETVKGVVAHPVVLDLVICPGAVPLIGTLQALVFGFVIYVIRRVGDDKVGRCSFHQPLNV